MKVALYLRVSTARQAEKDLSIPDQRNQLERWSKDRGWNVVAEYVEPGASATDDRRPQFQRMMDDAARPDRPFEAVLVHSFSRFFRDSFQFEMHRRSLEKNGVALISITQTVSADPSGQMFRQLCSMFDEYQSRETAKHVLRAMKENARLGFWNGSPAPYGYKAYRGRDTRRRRKEEARNQPGRSGNRAGGLRSLPQRQRHTRHCGSSEPQGPDLPPQGPQMDFRSGASASYAAKPMPERTTSTGRTCG